MRHDIKELESAVLAEFPDEWPWVIVGVFPSDVNQPDYSYFDYTVGLGTVELWCSCFSIEHHAADNDLIGQILNTIAGAWRMGLVHYGDEIVVPLGIANEAGEWDRDEDAIFWVPTWRVPSRVKQVYQSDCPWTVPLIWSSPLGWSDE